MGKSPPEKTQLAELTRRDITNAGGDLHEYAAVVPFTLEGNGQRAYIPTSVLRYYNPKAKLEPKDIRYLDPDFFEARIRDIGARCFISHSGLWLFRLAARPARGRELL